VFSDIIREGTEPYHQILDPNDRIIGLTHAGHVNNEFEIKRRNKLLYKKIYLITKNNNMCSLYFLNSLYWFVEKKTINKIEQTHTQTLTT